MTRLTSRQETQARVLRLSVNSLIGGIFTIGEYSHACRLQASLVLLRFGHARGKTTLSCFLTLSRRFATRSARRMRTHVAYATVFKSVH